MVLCEVSLKLYKKTHYATYSSYCNNISLMLKEGIVPRERVKEIYAMTETLERIFAMSVKESAVYVSTYFRENKCLIFERPVRMVKEFFPLTEDIY